MHVEAANALSVRGKATAVATTTAVQRSGCIERWVVRVGLDEETSVIEQNYGRHIHVWFSRPRGLVIEGQLQLQPKCHGHHTA